MYVCNTVDSVPLILLTEYFGGYFIFTVSTTTCILFPIIRNVFKIPQFCIFSLPNHFYRSIELSNKTNCILNRIQVVCRPIPHVLPRARTKQIWPLNWPPCIILIHVIWSVQSPLLLIDLVSAGQVGMYNVASNSQTNSTSLPKRHWMIKTKSGWTLHAQGWTPYILFLGISLSLCSFCQQDTWGTHTWSTMAVNFEMNQSVLIWWFKDRGLKFNIQKGFTVLWNEKSPGDVISNCKDVQAKWYPQQQYSKGHKGIHPCRILGYDSKFHL